MEEVLVVCANGIRLQLSPQRIYSLHASNRICRDGAFNSNYSNIINRRSKAVERGRCWEVVDGTVLFPACEDGQSLARNSNCPLHLFSDS